MTIKPILFLRNLRHNRFKGFEFLWKTLGRTYQIFLNILKFDKPIIQYIGRYGPYFLHPKFAFSDFASWGDRHNCFFEIYIKLSDDVDCFFDVGAHIGLIALPLSTQISKNGTIYCFEPSNTNNFYLNYHLEKNKVNNVKVIKKVVNSKSGLETDFFESQEVSGMNSVIEIENKQISKKTLKKSISLDEFCIENKIFPQIIKIDVEGSEIDLLKGAKKLIKSKRPIIFLSYHPSHILKLGYTPSDFDKLIKNFKYSVFDIKLKKIKFLKNTEYLLLPKEVQLKNFKKKLSERGIS